MMRKTCIFVLVLVLVSSCKDDDGETGYVVNRFISGSDTIEVARYYQNKLAAVSLTFDDGTLDQYEYAAPQLEKRGFRGTFNVNGHAALHPSALDMDTLQIMDLDRRGHEIGSHTWSHMRLTELSFDDVQIEIDRNDSAVAAWIGHKPYSLAFPHNARNKTLIRMASAGRVGVRTYETGFGQTYRTSTCEGMCRWMNSLLSSHEWGVAMYHGMTTGYDHWNDTTQLWRFWDTLKASEDRIWVAPFCEVSAYTQEAANVKFEMVSSAEKTLVRASSTLEPTLFNHPLTLIIKRRGQQHLKEIQPNDVFEL